MEFALVPGGVSTQTATVWIGAVRSAASGPADAWLEHPASGARWPVNPWEAWRDPDGNVRASFRRLSLTGLAPATKYPLQLRVGGTVRAHGSFTTLPVDLPADGETPFVVMLGSCFCRRKDAGGRVGQTFSNLPIEPAVKFLVGDQVYLDSPWYRFPIRRQPRTLAAWFAEEYAETWTQTAANQGFAHLLGRGATYFCSDDHEFWNNAPFPSSFASNTWTDGGRRAWWKIADGLYRAFQTSSTRDAFAVGSVSFLSIDTRRNRDNSRGAFMSQQDFTFFEAWVSGLDGPGILVLGQPVFADPAGLAGHIADWNFPDFAQYQDLCRVLMASRQSIVVLTGDVHFGRIATATLPSGANLVEVIASPMALVDRSAGLKWNKAPDWFPSSPLPGVASVRVDTTQGWSHFLNHFITLDLTAKGGGVRVVVKAWSTDAKGLTPDSRELAEFELKRNI